MSEYKIVNLKEVEDQAPNFGLSPDLEARFARVALEAELVGLTYQRLAPNFQVPWGHTHKTQEEVFVVISGGMKVKVNDEIKELGAVGCDPRREHDAARVRGRARRLRVHCDRRAGRPWRRREYRGLLGFVGSHLATRAQ